MFIQTLDLEQIFPNNTFCVEHYKKCSYSRAINLIRNLIMTESVIRSRIDQEVKTEATVLFKRMGLTMSEAIRLFLYQTIAEKRIPFSINVPNASIRLSLEEDDCGKNLEATSLKQLEQNWDKACGKAK
jgi:DNA-damage-inducible protein J